MQNNFGNMSTIFPIIKPRFCKIKNESKVKIKIKKTEGDLNPKKKIRQGTIKRNKSGGKLSSNILNYNLEMDK